jgi:hypothetical protein
VTEKFQFPSKGFYIVAKKVGEADYFLEMLKSVQGRYNEFSYVLTGCSNTSPQPARILLSDLDRPHLLRLSPMRGPDTFTEKLFTLKKLEDFVPPGHPLRPVRAMVNEALANMEDLLAGMYAQASRRRAPPKRLIAPLPSL